MCWGNVCWDCLCWQFQQCVWARPRSQWWPTLRPRLYARPARAARRWQHTRRRGLLPGRQHGLGPLISRHPVAPDTRPVAARQAGRRCCVTRGTSSSFFFRCSRARPSDCTQLGGHQHGEAWRQCALLHRTDESHCVVTTQVLRRGTTDDGFAGARAACRAAAHPPHSYDCLAASLSSCAPDSGGGNTVRGVGHARQGCLQTSPCTGGPGTLALPAGAVPLCPHPLAACMPGASTSSRAGSSHQHVLHLAPIHAIHHRLALECLEVQLRSLPSRCCRRRPLRLLCPLRQATQLLTRLALYIAAEEEEDGAARGAGWA